ncbi:hypothetical protein MJD09_17985 [bacterium]|nr:hypothetical protein [bacterium]
MKKYLSLGSILFCLLASFGWHLKGALSFNIPGGSHNKTLSPDLEPDMEDTYLKLFREFKQSDLISQTQQRTGRQRTMKRPVNPFMLPTLRQSKTVHGAAAGGSEQPKPWRVTGILWDEREPGAVINSKVVQVNSRIGSYRVISIFPEKVVLALGSRELVLNMHRPKSR